MHRAVLILLAAGIVALQCCVGGARLAFALPCYLLLALAGFAVLAFRRTATVRPDLFCIASAVALAGYLIARAAFSPVAMLARPDLFEVLAGLVTYLVCALVLCDTHSRLKLAIVLAVVGFVHVAVGIAQLRSQQNFMLIPGLLRPDYGYRASGLFISPNHLAAYLGMLATLSLSLCCWSRVPISARLLAFYGFVVCLVGVALTGSRAGYYSTGAALALFGVLSAVFANRFKRPHLFGLAMATAVGIIAVVAAALAFIVSSEIFEKNLRHVRDPSLQARQLISGARRQHQLAPVFGTGAGTVLFHARELSPPAVQADPRHVHQEYRELLAEYGWTGAALLAVFLAAHAAAALRGIRHILAQRLSHREGVASNELALLAGAICALALALIDATRDFTFHLPANALLAAFLCAILANPTVDSARRSAHRPLPPWLLALAPAVAAVLLVAAAVRLPSELLAERARRALRDHDHAAAVDLARRASVLDPANADAFYTLGDAARRLALETHDAARATALRRQALAAFESGLQAFPRDVRLLLALGQIRDDLGETAAGDASFALALAAAPRSGLVHALCGVHWHRQRQFEKARAFYRAAQELGESVFSAAGLRDLEHDEAIARGHNAFADLLPDSADAR